MLDVRMGLYNKVSCTIAPYGQVKYPVKVSKCVDLLDMLE